MKLAKKDIYKKPLAKAICDFILLSTQTFLDKAGGVKKESIVD